MPQSDQCPNQTNAPIRPMPQSDQCPNQTNAPIRPMPQSDQCPNQTNDPNQTKILRRHLYFIGGSDGGDVGVGAAVKVFASFLIEPFVAKNSVHRGTAAAHDRGMAGA